MRMKNEDIILYLKNLDCLNFHAIQIISVSLSKFLKLESVEGLRKMCGLGEINFRKGLNCLLENEVLEWVPEKSARKKALYYGKVLLDLGLNQIIKPYVLASQKEDLQKIRLKNLQKGRESKNKICGLEVVGSFWSDRGLGHKEPHQVISESNIINEKYLFTDRIDFKDNFNNKMNEGNKVPTAHLYRKAMARYVPQKFHKKVSK